MLLEILHLFLCYQRLIRCYTKHAGTYIFTYNIFIPVKIMLLSLKLIYYIYFKLQSVIL